MLAAHERPSMLVSTALTHHAAAVIAGSGIAVGGLYAAVDAASTQTIGLGSAGALMLAMVTLVFRTQQQQIRAQRWDMARMARRIAALEEQLDGVRRDGSRQGG